MSLEPIEPEAALELFLKDKEAELADASIKGHDYRLRHFVRWCHEQGIENLNTLTGRQLHEYRLWRRDDGDLNKVSEKTQMDSLRSFVRWLEAVDGVEQDLSEKVLSPTITADENSRDVMLDTVLKGVWLCSKHVGQHMIERGNGGKIISTASTVAHVGELGAGHYTAGKHGVVGLTKTLALELAEYDINVNAVSPTGVDTQMISGVAEAVGEEALEGMTELGGPTNVFEEGKLLEPQAVSEAYLWLASNAARRVTGIALPVDAGYLAK